LGAGEHARPPSAEIWETTERFPPVLGASWRGLPFRKFEFWSFEFVSDFEIRISDFRVSGEGVKRRGFLVLAEPFWLLASA
jgi:hypothetical protein